MKTLLVSISIISCAGQTFSQTAPVLRTTNSNSSDAKIHFSQIVSDFSKAYGLTVCIEDTSEKNAFSLNDVQITPSEADFSRIRFGESLKLLQDHGVSYILSSNFMVFRSKDLDPQKTPLVSEVQPFSFKGNVEGLFEYIATHVSGVSFYKVSANGGEERCRDIDVKFDSKVTIEGILNRLAKDYKIIWTVAVSPKDENQPATLLVSFNSAYISGDKKLEPRL